MNVRIAASWWRRMQGLAGVAMETDENDALLLVPCNAIHTFTMHRPIDVAFIDHTGVVRRTYLNLPPRRSLSCPGACATLERLSPWGNGELEGEVPSSDGMPDDGWLHVGERLELGSSWTQVSSQDEEASEREEEIET
jgi:uncharacterized membrane protein (UPF0127 family)